MANSLQDKTLNKVAVCSAVFAGFAYVGYSYARSAFCRKLYRHPEDGNEDETPQISHMVLKRISQTTQTDSFFGNLHESGPGKFIKRPKSVQERIRELNQKAQQFTDAFLAIQSMSSQSSSAVSRNYAVHGFNSIQCSPWSSPKVLSPIDARNHILSRSTDNLHQFPQSRSSSRPRWIRRSLRKKQKEESVETDAEIRARLEEEALNLLQHMPQELIDRLNELSINANVLTPLEAKCLVAILYSPDVELVEKALVTVANCAAFSVNLDFLREGGCIHRLATLMENPRIRLAAVQTLGNVVLSEENIKQAKECLPLLMDYVQGNHEDDGLRLASLIVLTNLATTTDWHEEFSQILPRLYELVDSTNVHIQLQSLRILVNLSCNKHMIPSLLAAQGPKKLGYLLSMDTSEPLLLRSLTFLATLSSFVKYDHIDSTIHLPADDKVASLDTMYAFLFGVGVRELLLSRAQEIMERHEHREINRQASRLYEALRI